MQNFGNLMQGEHFQNWGWMEEVENLMENWPYFGNGERYGQGYY